MLRSLVALRVWIPLCLALTTVAAAPLTLTLPEPKPAESGYFKMGAARSPDGHILAVDSRTLRRDGRAWLPVMGEMHYSRYPAAEWREELLKMKAGGVDIVATYVFWIHHEEVEGTWDWSGARDLRRFVETARDVGLDVIVRCGPWCHGEVRNGGLPEWVVARTDWKLRSLDPAFLAATRQLYAQIAAQVRGLLWKDGGPVVGIQVDNEYPGPAEYLLELKRMARAEGLDVPLYTRTGWPALTTPMPLGEIVPLYGVYAEGFWDRQTTSMPGRYWAGFHFSALRTDAAIATEMLGNRAAKDDVDAAKYPYLTCEIGGGMMNSYHRRILIDPCDIEVTTLIKVAGGSTLPGYYMYHGGTNPEGVRTTLMEAQDTRMTNYNDLPVKTYDFQAPLGEYGEVRPQYHRLRRLHLFLREFEQELAAMTVALPDVRPAGRDDVTTLRWAARSDGRRGFVFVNNYERGRVLAPKAGVQFALRHGEETVTFPTQPVTIPSGVSAWWPFNLNLGGVTLVSATAQPFSRVVEPDGSETLFFAETPGVAAEFVFKEESGVELTTSGRLERTEGRWVVRDVAPGRGWAVRAVTNTGRVLRCVLLSEADSLAFWKGPLGGRERALLTRATVVFEHDTAQVTAAEGADQEVAVYPVPAEMRVVGAALSVSSAGLFGRVQLPVTATVRPVAFERVREAGPARAIKVAPTKQGVAMQPTEAEFAAAAVWRVTLPEAIDWARRPLLRFNYVGDVARVKLGDTLVTDDFYNGRPRNLGLWRHAAALRQGELRLEVLPLVKDAPIFLAEAARPAFADGAPVAELKSVELIETGTCTLSAAAGPQPK
ncbi:beta-galactosidase [Opitutus sp. ER46]|uniref:beta-galactosidase n=1 Tax=Opitutus sp. ER46 TaxID=2161864 RepID=UPI000D2F6E14|nr:beta-galactosidase [Opitutus sp. ER46]PTX91421.1 glycosyl hydrolase family 35 [Opitutus sp. ER46]